VKIVSLIFYGSLKLTLNTIIRNESFQFFYETISHSKNSSSRHCVLFSLLYEYLKLKYILIIFSSIFEGLQQPSSMDYHSSIAGVQDDDDHDDHEDQAIGNRQSVIKFKDIGEEDDLEREV
jgi:hypothetical protein